MQRLLVAVLLALMSMMGTVAGTAAQGVGCRWIGEGSALLCDDGGDGAPTVATWQAGGWTTVPAVPGGALPATAGGLSTYGRSYPPSPVTPAAGYASAAWSGNTLSQTSVVYGPGSQSHALTCNTAYSSSAWYGSCR